MNFSFISLNIVQLNLRGNGFYGIIPPKIGALFNLKYFNLSRNYLTGQLPPSLGNLSRLELLDIADNQIDHSIPSTLETLKNLVTLNLSFNKIPGSLSFIAGMTNLVHLFVGEISSFVKMKKLISLNIEDNRFVGEIPPFLCHSPIWMRWFFSRIFYMVPSLHVYLI
ncbi:hypothetical protein REPUB_Repub15cG0076000 [Reevesia pubescens]